MNNYLCSPFNKWPGSEYECSTRLRVNEFNCYLNSHGIRSTIRWSRGEGKDCKLFNFYLIFRHFGCLWSIEI